MRRYFIAGNNISARHKRCHKLQLTMSRHYDAAIESRTIAIIALSLFISGCVYYPRKIEYYDAQCDITVKKLVLETKEMKDACASPDSSDPEGKTCLAGIASLSAMSAIVSGSIVVVGSTVYWLEKEGRCITKTKF